MMAQNGTYTYYTDDVFQMVALPYQNRRLDMVILLPSTDTKLERSPAPADAGTLAAVDGENEPCIGGTVEMPRFRAEYGVELREALSTLGMGEAFEPHADFSAMSHEPLFISKVMHKTFVNVDEQGTEAAAATAVLWPQSAYADPCRRSR